MRFTKINQAIESADASMKLEGLYIPDEIKNRIKTLTDNNDVEQLISKISHKFMVNHKKESDSKDEIIRRAEIVCDTTHENKKAVWHMYYAKEAASHIARLFNGGEM